MPVVGLIRTGNWRSVQNALEHLGAEICVPGDALQTHMIIPGQGSMASCMQAIVPFIRQLERSKDSGMPILGICAGMHAMCRHSEEGDVEGLGWLPYDVVKLPDKRLPRMGWKTTVRGDFYLCHSYGVLDYGLSLDSVQTDNLFGCQFHPEKSQQAGLDFLREFLEWHS